MRKRISELLNKKEYKKAEILLSSHLKSSKEDKKEIFEIYVLLGWLYDQWALVSNDSLKGKYQRQAKKYFKSSVKNKDTKQESIRGLATVLMHQDKLLDSLKYYKKAHNLRKNFNTYNDLGNIYRKLRKNKLSVSFYEKALSKTGNKEESSISLYNLVMINRDLNNQKKEKEYFNILNNLAKNSSFARIMLDRLS